VSEIPSVRGTPGLAGAVARVLGDRGPLRAALPDFEPRPGQREMAAAVAEVFERGGALLAEAGTGTGKTLAYLTPAVLCRQRVLVSTGTKNLQEQILSKDLPVLQAALGIEFAAVCMKGRGNYLCLHRLDLARQRVPEMDRAWFERIVGWADETATGDRAELEDLPEDFPAWKEVSSTAETCVGSRCPRYHDCFVTRMREQASAADIVIVNHHLLCADAAVRHSTAGEVIPACSHAVVDEAHQLEDVATQYFGMSVSSYRFEELAGDTDRMLTAGALQDEEGQVREALARLRDRTWRFFEQLASLAAPATRFDGGILSTGGDDRIRVDQGTLGRLSETGSLLIGALETLSSTLSLLEGAAEDGASLARRATELRDELGFLLQASDPDYVYYLERRGRGWFLRASPVDVSTYVREMLVDRMHATVLTSATLSVDGTFDYVRDRLGLTEAAEISLPSEFDYSQQALLYLPASMPDPRSDSFPAAAGREIVGILRETGGRAFVLFTSYAVLRRVRVIVESELPYPVLAQGDLPRSVLLNRFRTTPQAVLLGTSSFWQGVDVAGEALSCVIIDKLPFASPGDPVTAARIERLSAQGRNAFAEYQVPLAILTLKQGLGRLIRHRRDRGVLVILDPRLKTKLYGRRFLASLPPAPTTWNQQDIGRFLGVGVVGSGLEQE
jgi:ATP-dependent DNA helicase DinG